MSLEELSQAWNDLRNAALGRGTKPKVSPALARQVAASYELWRVARGNFSPLVDVLTTPSTRSWVTLYRRLVAKVRKDGVKLPAGKVLPLTPLESVMASADRFAKNMAIGAGIFGAGLVTYFVVSKGGRGGQ